MQQLVGIGFNKLKPGKMLLDTSQGGIFCFRESDMDNIDKSTSKLGKGRAMKQRAMLSYLFELCYDLCLSQDNNISESAGFECLLGHREE